eukprot:m.356328 g.356328  ORF g.356328 m.356328 type:complete len:139 (+) comp90162_c0_seq1:17-433(+)
MKMLVKSCWVYMAMTCLHTAFTTSTDLLTESCSNLALNNFMIPENDLAEPCVACSCLASDSRKLSKVSHSALFAIQDGNHNVSSFKDHSTMNFITKLEQNVTTGEVHFRGDIHIEGHIMETALGPLLVRMFSNLTCSW